MRRLVVAITGATGALYAVRMLQVLRGVEDVETHLVVSASGVLNIQHEMDITRQEVQALADHVYGVR
ncbi:flavoprotein, partial [Bordetella avium]